MVKDLPREELIILHNQLKILTQRDPIRRRIVAEAAKFYNVSHATIYRALNKFNKPKLVSRADYNQPRIITQDEMQRYCEIIAALKLRTSNKKGHHLSTKECLRLLEDYGIETPEGLIKAPAGLLKKSTVSVYLSRLGLTQKALHIQPTVVHFQAEQSNECWQFDFSPSDFKRFPEDKSSKDAPKLMILSVVDDRSGVIYPEYYYTHGEDAVTALKFLFNAMAPKKDGSPFQGIPKVLYMDNGPVAKSTLFKRVMAFLNIEIRTHLPDGKDGRRKTSRSKGKVERQYRNIKNILEPLYHLHPPKNLPEANEWLRHYSQRCNEEMHRREDHSRIKDWQLHLPPEGFRVICNWEEFSTACLEPETRKVGSDACVSIEGVPYQLSNELSGLTVTLLWKLFDNELYVEHERQQYGPFHPAKEPIPFGQYRPFKKSQREKKADHIGELAKAISIPRAALSGATASTEQLLDESKLVQEKLPSVPFSNQLVTTTFQNAIDAKVEISKWLGFSLGRLQAPQMASINALLAETLDKEIVMARVKKLFEIRTMSQQEEPL